MIKNRNILKGTVAVIGLLVLILDSATAVCGIREGVTLCIQSVFPSLFPFIFLSSILMSSITFKPSGQSKRKCRPIHISPGKASLLLSGYLGGYPVGAQNVAQVFQKRQLNRQEAQRLVIVCNNPGPAFIFGVTASMFAQKWIPWLLWAIHIVSSFLLLVVVPSNPGGFENYSESNRPASTATLLQTLRTMASICGWVILFRAIICILQRWCLWLLPEDWKIIVCGLLEMTNGCLLLNQIECTGLRFSLCAFFLSFGGVCTAIQTFSVAQGLNCHGYLRTKALEGLCSLIMAYFFQILLLSENDRFQLPSRILITAAGVMILLILSIRKSKIKGRILSAVGV